MTKSQILFLMVLFASGVQCELRPDAENVCPQKEWYQETILRSVQKLVPVDKKKWCWNTLRKCTRRNEEWKTVIEPQLVDRLRVIPKCCSGYEENAGRCVPICPQGCVHGRCTAPYECICTSGFRGQACNQSIIITTFVPKTTAYITHISDITTQSMSQATDPIETGSTMYEILKPTETDEVTQTTKEIIISMTEATPSLPDDKTPSTLSENEKEISAEVSANAEVTPTTEENLLILIPRTEVKYMNFMEQEKGVKNEISNFTEKANSEGDEEPVVEFEEPNEIITPLLYTLCGISASALVVAGYITARRRKMIREAQSEKLQMNLFSKERNFFWGRKSADSLTGASDTELDNNKPVLVDFQVRDQSPVTHSKNKSHSSQELACPLVF